MSRQDYPYDEDEFDVLGADRTPQGVHRAPVPRWRQLLPFAIVIVVAPLLAWAGVSILSGNFGSEPDPTPAVTATEDQTEEETEGENGDGENGTDPESTEEDEPENGDGENGTDEDNGEAGDEATEEDPTDDPVDLDRDVRILILNGAGVAGIAGSTAETLNNEGWTNTSTADYGQALPTDTTLYYHDAQVAEEAEAVAADLGIEATVESASAASSGIVIVLRPDFVG
ncbi:LytR C-terminal domain-containing protein [Pseudactinotalea sp. Z1748]|uniref:LytR C-terminal domain-containing protein n=1 Tax=Pseudactinotalea sp. Z1748 TaxID=3413027 RepID=UPI003C7AA83C